MAIAVPGISKIEIKRIVTSHDNPFFIFFHLDSRIPEYH